MGVEQLEGDAGDETGHPQQENVAAGLTLPDCIHGG